MTATPDGAGPRRRPLVGLPGRRRKAAAIAGFPESLHDLDVDLYLADYSRGVLAAGGLPVNLPMDADPTSFLDHLDAVVLPGGADVDPARYGHDDVGSDVEAERDLLELALFAGARERDLPVLGICRGFQLVNVALGGTLHQDVPCHSRYDLDPAAVAHPVSIVDGTILHDLFGPEHEVNSLHHQTLATVADGIRITATADDGTPEGFETTDGRVLAVQWHPEMMGSDGDPTFRWLVELARRP